MQYEYNDLLEPWKNRSVQKCGMDELRERSQRCVVFIQNKYPDAVLAKAAYDAEILRKESQESEGRNQQRHEELISSQKNQHKKNDGDKWYKKVIIGIVISVSAGLLLLLIKLLLGI